jgi:hypothetical protein
VNRLARRDAAGLAFVMSGVEFGMERGPHARLVEAGWSYRTNAERGWVIYRDPATQLWHPRGEAIRILEAAGVFPQSTASTGQESFGDAVSRKL